MSEPEPYPLVDESPVSEIISILRQAIDQSCQGCSSNANQSSTVSTILEGVGSSGSKSRLREKTFSFRLMKIYRGAFLWGCANAVGGIDHELMLLGFGRTEGQRNSITAFMKTKGRQHSVSPTPEALNEISAHLATDSRNSIILVHNHPEHIVSSALALLLGPEPLPSLTDRDTALSALIDRFQRCIKGDHHGEVRFFLVQNDEVSEFSGLNAGSATHLRTQPAPAPP